MIKILPKFKVIVRIKITKYKNNFGTGYTEIWSREIFAIDSLRKTNPWTFKIKNSNGETITDSFDENEFLLSKLEISCYLSCC